MPQKMTQEEFQKLMSELVEVTSRAEFTEEEINSYCDAVEATSFMKKMQVFLSDHPEELGAYFHLGVQHVYIMGYLAGIERARPSVKA